MLFNSPIFLLFFLPISLLVYWAFRVRNHPSMAVNWLILASFFFYGWWDVRYVGLIGAGIVFNYFVAKGILKNTGYHKKALLTLGVTANLGLLAYFKYTDFFISTINRFGHTHWPLMDIILPLGISFFVFQKIAFLIDAYRGEFHHIGFQQFTAFVIFFPQLIAGPIPKHNELFVQFEKNHTFKIDWEGMALGITAFACGLFKKTVIADGLATYASPFFTAVASGTYIPTFIESWSSATAYAFQIYFDFSGYSDMALGLAVLFGYRLPVNFFSPYKAASIIDFWRRWHITLSRFLRDYLYISLGGNRHGFARQKINLVLTMILGGLWHGAGFSFIIWGMLHGLYLIINHGWWRVKTRLGFTGAPTAWGTWCGRVLTLLCVLFAWVFFRADNIHSAVYISSTMLGLNGITLNPTHIDALGPIAHWIGATPMHAEFFYGTPQLLVLVGLLAFIWIMPNTYEYLASRKFAILTYHDKATNPNEETNVTQLPQAWWQWRPSWLHMALGCGIMSCAAWYTLQITEFLYFQF